MQTIEPWRYPSWHRSSPEQVIQLVCDTFSFTREELLAHDRHMRLAWARQVAMWLMRRHCKMSSTMVASVLGKKDHGTVLWGSEVVSNMASVDARLKRELDDMERKLIALPIGDNSAARLLTAANQS